MLTSSMRHPESPIKNTQLIDFQYVPFNDASKVMLYRCLQLGFVEVGHKAEMLYFRDLPVSSLVASNACHQSVLFQHRQVFLYHAVANGQCFCHLGNGHA